MDTLDAEGWLLAIARRRDRDAFVMLFRSYAPRLKGYLMGLGAAPGTAEELAQEILLQVWRKAEQFDPARGTASAWIFAVARNAFVSQIRRERRAEVEPDDPILVPCDTSAEELMTAAQDQHALAAALGALPPEQAEALRGAYYRGRSLPELASEQGVPLGTIKTRVRLGLERLRHLVAAHRRSS